MLTAIAQPTYLRSAGVGASAGIIGSVVQVAVGLVIDKCLLPPRHDNNIAPRLVTRLFQKRGQPANRVRDWTLGTLFHFVYGIGWGCAFGLARRAFGIPSPLLGGAMGLLIYLLAFSGVGAGTQTGTETHPRHRNRGKQLSLIVVAGTFAMSTAAIYDRLVRRS
jgi:hypothetical protein